MNDILVPANVENIRSWKLARIEKTIFPSVGTSFTAYNEHDQILVVVPVKSKSVSNFMARSISKYDQARMERAINDARPRVLKI